MKASPKYQNSRQCECGRKNLFFFYYCRGCFWVGAADEVKSHLHMTPPFFLSQNWMNGRCWIIKAMLIFCHGFSCTQFLYLMSLSGRRRDTSRATPTIDTDTFCIYSHFLELFLSAALAINPRWPRVWCSINTTTHAQTRARVAGSIGSCVQTSFLFIINARKASKYEIRVCFDRVFALGLY